ncbi:TIGR04149 family rSAM-modified RiPP [Algoriphagus resistens]|uniref:TIGR04149 family rSAM-modified RiPP n=1 Tax=Algoriphagus resistens TaxID=1750590 RepID=UPI000716C20D|nr:TIGR04149 family rSAM-modified RiPP [Algoriphagus resistens]
MKKLSLGKLKILSNEVLEKSQLSTVYGGSGGCSYSCYCGGVGGCGQDYPFAVTADSLSEAQTSAAGKCHGLGATCA